MLMLSIVHASAVVSQRLIGELSERPRGAGEAVIQQWMCISSNTFTIRIRHVQRMWNHIIFCVLNIL